MNNNTEEKNIHEFDFSLICDYFSSLKRQGPGSDEATLRALKMIPTIGEDSTIADLGCGTGSSTIILAEETHADITAIDLFPNFLKILNKNALNSNLSKYIRTLQGDMADIPFAKDSLDLIWCEGAIYNIGFEKGLTTWRPFLKMNGYVAVSESTWLTAQRPKEIQEFWDEAYSEMTTVDSNLDIIKKSGYELIDWFVLPQECWTENFYEPAAIIQEKYLARNADNPFAQELVQNQRHEAAMYKKYHQYYGYVFYIAKKE